MDIGSRHLHPGEVCWRCLEAERGVEDRVRIVGCRHRFILSLIIRRSCNCLASYEREPEFKEFLTIAVDEDARCHVGLSILSDASGLETQ